MPVMRSIVLLVASVNYEFCALNFLSCALSPSGAALSTLLDFAEDFEGMKTEFKYRFHHNVHWIRFVKWHQTAIQAPDEPQNEQGNVLN